MSGKLKNISRRRFIGGLVVSALAFGWIFEWCRTAFFPRNPERMMARLMKKRLSYLTLEEEGLEIFVSSYLSDYPYALHKKLIMLDAARMVLPLSYCDQVLSKYEKGPDSFLEKAEVSFLLGSDFFMRGGEVTAEPVRFTRLYDPISAPCSNPFWIMEMAKGAQ
jgi:hypothetical protein